MNRLPSSTLPLGALMSLIYVVLLGGTSVGEFDLSLRAVTAAIGGTFIASLLVISTRRTDRIDAAVLLATALFVLTALFSMLPRLSLDAAVAGLAFSGAYVASRRLVSAPEAPTLLIWTLRALALVVAMMTAVAWLPRLVEWWFATGRDVIPPLDFSFNATPWGHRHDLALLVVMLYPAWWLGPASALVRVARLILGAVVFSIVIADGSRSLWLAMAVGTVGVVVIGARRSSLWRRETLWAGAAVLAVVAIVSIAAGVAQPFVERILTLNTLEARSAMWKSIIAAFTESPIAGKGPGTFPWVLQATGYFDTNSWAPRHPDSVPFQTLAEAGLLGITAQAVLVAALFRPLLQAPWPVAWPLFVFAGTGIGASPTDFAFLIAPAIAWAALATPLRDAPGAVRLVRRRWIVRASAVLLVVMAGASVTAFEAHAAYSAARAAVDAGNLPAAIRSFSTAVRLDPYEGIYSRQRGTALLIAGRVDEAINDLRTATVANPFDDLAWRALAMAQKSSGSLEDAAASLAQAVEVQRSDPSNLLLAARQEIDLGHKERATDIVGEIVLTWPSSIGAAGWDEFFELQITDTAAVESAVGRWLNGGTAATSIGTEGVWLTALSGDDTLIEPARTASRFSDALIEAYLAVLSCDDDASAVLASAPAAERRTADYWALRIRASLLEGTLDRNAVRAYRLMTNANLITEAPMNPLNENGLSGFSADTWGYRREPIEWPTYGRTLPSVPSSRWLVDPQAVGLDVDLPALSACKP